MQRVRIGLTGLAFVFVLVLLAAVFSPSEEEPITPSTLDQQAGRFGDVNSVAEPKEPLAELGVAPGNADINSAQGKLDGNLVQPQR